MNCIEKPKGRVFRFQVLPKHKGLRLDLFLTAALAPSISRSQLQRLIAGGDVRINGKTAKASLRLSGDENVMVRVPPSEPLQLVAEAKPLAIVYEDRYLLVVDKPAGMVVHPAPGHQRGTLVNALLSHCGQSFADVGVEEQRPGIVHRLDKDTSGLLVVAKTKIAYTRLVSAFKQRAVDRTYLCLVHGGFKPEASVVEAPIGRHPKMRLKMTVIANGRPARTYLKVLEWLGDYTYLEARLHSGRTHQIRVHLAFTGHPIVGDYLYGRQKDLKLSRQFLHAARLGFFHPLTGERLEFTSPLPDDLQKVIQRLRGQ
ncbi:MAG TPA: RluA family pseudouridine synthase [bacterium]|nr:RluA family pseudouridine synthase [bacterium]